MSAIWREGDLSVVRLAAADEPFQAVLAGTQFGGTGLRYVRTNFPDVLARWQQAGAAFLALRKGDRTVGTFVLVPHDVAIDGSPVRAWYRTALAIAPEAQGNRLGHTLTSAARRAFLAETSGPVVLYGFVDRDNQRSLGLQTRLGYAQIASFEALTLGWLRPRPIDGIGPLAPSERDGVLAALTARWGGAILGDDWAAGLRPDEHLVLRRGGEPVAGVQIRPTVMDIVHLGGLDGRILTAVAPTMQAFSPFFALRPNRHLWLGYPWWRGDDPGPLLELIEGALHEHRVSQGIMYLDPRSSTYAALKAAGLGIVNRLSPSPVMRVMAGWNGVPDSVIKALSERPIVYSPLDAA